MSTIESMRAAIVASLRRSFPALANKEGAIEPHKRMEFTTADLDEALKRGAVALRVAFTGVPEDITWSSGEVDMPTGWAVYLCTKDTVNAGNCDALALEIIPSLALAIAPGNWGDVTGALYASPTNERAKCIYPGEVDGKTMQVWELTWTQVVTFVAGPDGTDPLGVFPLLTLITKYDLAPGDGVFEATDVTQPRSTP